jgi:ribosome-associated heat shock protein Hsp15
VRTGDVVTVALDRTVRVLKVTGFVERRGPAGTAKALYEDLNANPGGQL